ncbi:VOC family protein [Nocardioides pantholopis]|uniref:VOC family protein n=1 Tax=Nocardioides pantholopis TaxID=2483798 RepID=UPI000F07D9EC|nr:VOC family protein [Nocardioides pantholopis]
MTVRLNPYLTFRDSAREAMEFYQSVLGGELTRSTYGEFGMSQDPAEADKTMHAQLLTPGGLTLMASDVPASVEHDTGSSIVISLSGEDEAELRGYWTGLAQGATIEQELQSAPWGDSFGMLQDRFGVTWMVNIAGPSEQ